MFRSFLKDELWRKNLSQKSAAQQIGITPVKIKEALENSPVDEQTIEAICKWLEVPSTPLITSDQEKVFEEYEKYVSGDPNFVIVMKDVAREVKQGELKEDDLRDLVEYAVTKIKQRGSGKRHGPIVDSDNPS